MRFIGGDAEKMMDIKTREIIEKLGGILEPWLDGADDNSSLGERTNLFADMGLDSVAILQLILGIEKEFCISINESEMDSDMFSKVSNLVDVIKVKLNETD